MIDLMNIVPYIKDVKNDKNGLLRAALQNAILGFFCFKQVFEIKV